MRGSVRTDVQNANRSPTFIKAMIARNRMHAASSCTRSWASDRSPPTPWWPHLVPRSTFATAGSWPPGLAWSPMQHPGGRARLGTIKRRSAGWRNRSSSVAASVNHWQRVISSTAIHTSVHRIPVPYQARWHGGPNLAGRMRKNHTG